MASSSLLWWILRLFFFIGLVAVLYVQVTGKEHFPDVYSNFLERVGSASSKYWWLALLLVPFNWWIETLKWQQLLREVLILRPAKAFAAVLTGVAVSMFLPNRMGEFGGRLIYVPAQFRVEAALASICGNLAQWLVLTSFGLAGVLVLSGTGLELNTFWWKITLVLGIALLSIMYTAYFNIDLVIPLAQRIPWVSKQKVFLQHLEILNRFSTKDLSRALGFALVRYIIYTMQYWLMLQFFGIQPPATVAFAGIAALFLWQTSVPMPPLFALLARGELAVQVWGPWTEQPIFGLAASLVLWIINLAIPALVGGFMFLLWRRYQAGKKV